jgi:transposase-like protein
MKYQPKTRKKRSADEKLALLKRHLVKGEKVSDICDKEGITPSQFYACQQALFENGAQCLERKARGSVARESKQVQELQSKLDRTKSKLFEKHEVLSELMSAYISLKKALGPRSGLGGAGQT